MPDPEFDQRLRAHLGRVAGHEAPPGLEARVVDAAYTGRRLSTPAWQPALVVLLTVAVLVAVLVLTLAGKQQNNVFLNVSNGLN